jgi:hypothetical protein
VKWGVVTFTHFTCQPRCALKDRNQENQSVKGLEVRANPTGNGLFLASVTTPYSKVTDCSHSEFPFGTLQVSLDSIGLAGKNFDGHCHI